MIIAQVTDKRETKVADFDVTELSGTVSEGNAISASDAESLVDAGITMANFTYSLEDSLTNLYGSVSDAVHRELIVSARTITIDEDEKIPFDDHAKVDAIALRHDNDNAVLVVSVIGTDDQLSAQDNLNNLASTDAVTFEVTSESTLDNISTMLDRTKLTDGCITFTTGTHQITGDLSEFATYADSEVSVTDAFAAASLATSNNVPLKLTDNGGIAVGSTNNNILILTHLLSEYNDFQFTITKVANNNGFGALENSIIEDFTTALELNNDTNNVTIDFGIIMKSRLTTINPLLEVIDTDATGTIQDLDNDSIEAFKGGLDDNITIATDGVIEVGNAIILAGKTSVDITYTDGISGTLSDFIDNNNAKIESILAKAASFTAKTTNAISVQESIDLNAIDGVTAAPQKLTDQAGNLTDEADNGDVTAVATVSNNASALITISDNVSIDQLAALADVVGIENLSYTTIEDVPEKLFVDVNDTDSISDFIQPGINVIVSEQTDGAELLTAINSAIKVGENNGTLTATVENTISQLSDIPTGSADVLNYIVTDDENPTPAELNDLKQDEENKENTITATITMKASEAGDLQTRPRDSITIIANGNDDDGVATYFEGTSGIAALNGLTLKTGAGITATVNASKAELTSSEGNTTTLDTDSDDDTITINIATDSSNVFDFGDEVDAALMSHS